jgi:hypothetical protein
MKSLPVGTPSNLSSPAPTQRSFSNTPSLPFYQIESFELSSPAQSVIPAPPAAATPTPAPAPAPVAVAPEAIALDIEASPVPTERTAFKLAKHLRNFQGCIHE